ncbi:MAG: TRAP transporter substrate-binding protein DctP [Burkholderiales bacterium]|nr:TRAP transporter substrate-binding protein DctP [Burkholderiales bacterium]
MKRVRTAVALGLAGLIALWLPHGAAFAQTKMRISLDTNASHVRNISTEAFAAVLKQRIGDKLAVEIYPSAQLFRDRDIPKALRQDAVEMGIPGTWQLDGVAPNTAIQTLPMFYGVDEATVHKIMDGKVGQFINKRMEERLKVKILGKWMDLGFQHFYSVSKPIRTYSDLKGMKIRFPGGSANAARIKALGGAPTLIPWPDLPLALSQGVVEGVTTTHQSAVTAKLWDSGLKNSFEDFQYFGQYVPMVNLDFWNKQPKNVQDALVASWNAIIVHERQIAHDAQIEARDTLMKHSMKIVTASPADIVATRKHLMTTQAGLVKEMKIDADAVDLALKELKAAGVKF